MNFRQLIAKAMHEARDEFAAIVVQKLEALMGDHPAPARRGRPPKVAATNGAPAAARNGASRGRGKQHRAAPDHMANLQEKILHAMTPGEAMKKAAIMKAARVADSDALRVGNILAKLKGAGVLSMKGERGSAVYTLKG
jgi:hypothetical protein